MRFPVAALLVAACTGTELPEGTGEGLVTVDRVPPPGVEVVQRPEWKVGDQFAYRRGGKLTTSYRVKERTPAGYAVVEEGTGMVFELTPDLCEKARYVPTNASALRLRDPADYALTWPLWVGKRWTCHYVEKRPGEASEPVRVHSRCEAEEVIETDFGVRLKCLRIVHQARLELAGQTFLDKTAIHYYSPQVGWYARRIEDGVRTELERYHRQ